MKQSTLPASASPAEHIDARIQELGDWRGQTLTKVRALILKADPSKLFNSSLDGNTRRAIDIPEDAEIDGPALQALVRGAAALNATKAKPKAR